MHGAQTARFEDTYKSAWQIIDHIIGNDPPDSLLVQEEMVDLRKRLPETEAAITLYSNLQKLLVDQQLLLKQLRDDAQKENNAELVDELNAQYNSIQEKLQMTFEQLETLKIPLGRRIRLFFNFFQGTRAHSIEIGALP